MSVEQYCYILFVHLQGLDFLIVSEFIRHVTVTVYRKCAVSVVSVGFNFFVVAGDGGGRWGFWIVRTFCSKDWTLTIVHYLLYQI